MIFAIFFEIRDLVSAHIVLFVEIIGLFYFFILWFEMRDSGIEIRNPNIGRFEFLDSKFDI